MSEECSGFFRYNNFTAPSLLTQISTGHDMIYLYKMYVVELPTNNALRNKMGPNHRGRILSGFYEKERLRVVILEDICSIMRSQ